MTEIIAGDCNWRARKNVTMTGDLTKEQGLDKILVEGKTTEEELKNRVQQTLFKFHHFECSEDDAVAEIEEIYREAGWNPLTCCDRCPHYPEVWKEKWDASEHYKD